MRLGKACVGFSTLLGGGMTTQQEQSVMYSGLTVQTFVLFYFSYSFDRFNKQSGCLSLILARLSARSKGMMTDFSLDGGLKRRPCKHFYPHSPNFWTIQQTWMLKEAEIMISFQTCWSTEPTKTKKCHRSTDSTFDVLLLWTKIKESTVTTVTLAALWGCTSDTC